MKIETRKRLTEGGWSQEESVTSASWTVSAFIEGNAIKGVRVYVMNEHKRMLVLTFNDVDEVKEFAKELLEQVKTHG